MEKDDPSFHDKSTGADSFARNLAARANAFCRCKPPFPPRFPAGDDADDVRECVAQQAILLLEDSLEPVAITGAKPAIDADQMTRLTEYLVERGVDPPDAGPCDLDMWMEAVATAARDSRSSGTVVNIPIWRTDRRHPSLWSEIGFMSASRKSTLTNDAQPAAHYYSHGSQVWVSASSHMSGIDTMLTWNGFDGESFEPDVCIVYDSRTHRFAPREPTFGVCDVLPELGAAAADGFEINTPLLVNYVYGAVGVDVYRPDRKNLAHKGKEKEVLSLGFRPSAYKGAVVLLDDNRSKFYTKEFPVQYAPQRRCIQAERPPFASSTPFDGLPQRTVRETAGVECSRDRDACAACLELVVPARWCAMFQAGSP